MTLVKKCPLFFLLFVIVAVNSYAQEFPYKRSKQDTTIPMSALFHFKQDIYYLREKVKLQQYEIRVLKELGKIDSLQYGNDSIVTLYTSKTGVPLLRITEKHKNPQNNFEDSIVVFYNKNGLIEYSEMWQPMGKKKERDMKLTCRRFEYDDQNRLIRQVSSYPTPRVVEWIYTYDAAGNFTKDGRTLYNFDFWDFEKSKRTIPQ
jgi:hypothetical protein